LINAILEPLQADLFGQDILAANVKRSTSKVDVYDYDLHTFLIS